MMEEGQKTAHLNMDNPLSQDPESIWGRFFRNAELEKSIDKDLSRLYPEHGSYFQTPACQAMLRRILLVWSLRHPEYSYRQGMHELLAPLLYVLHVDVAHLSHVKHLFENLSDERFDGLPLLENNSSPRGNIDKQTKMSPVGTKLSGSLEDDRSLSDYGEVDILKCQANRMRISSIDELDPEVRAIFSGSDAYGAEGELGALLSGRFIEHDAYCMFDALLSGQGGLIAMADYFMNYPEVGLVSGLSPVIEASAHLYNLLSVIDSSLYSHLVELHVEPQFFALRWLRVLFGREFVLHELLLIWDAIFSAPNSSLLSEDTHHLTNIAYCDRGAFISAMAVSMLLHLRSSLLACPDATTCLKKLLNFPCNSDVRKLIENAVSIQPLAMNSVCIAPYLSKMGRNSDYTRMGKHTRSTSVSPMCQTPPISYTSVIKNQRSSPCSPDGSRVTLPESYWEEKWITSILQKVMPEKSSSNEVQDDNSKDSVGHGGEIISIDSSNLQHLVLDSNEATEQQISRNKNCGTSLKHDLDAVSSGTRDSNNETFGKASRHKVFDDQVEVDSQAELDFDKLLMSTTNEQLVSVQSVQGNPVTETVEKKSSDCDINDVNKIQVTIQEELTNQSKGVGNGSCQSNQCKESHADLKEVSGKFTTGNASQMGGILTFWRKQKPSAVTHTGRPRWMWNLARNIPGAKVKEPSKDGLAGNSNGSSESEKVPQKDKVNGTATTNDDTLHDEFSKPNFDLDCRKPEGNNQVPEEKSIDDCFKDESSTPNADVACGKKMFEEHVPPGKSTPACDGKKSSQETVTPSHIAVSSTPCLELVLEDTDGTTCSNDVKGTEVLNGSVINTLQSSAELSTGSGGEDPSINLRIMGQSILQKIQVLESSLLQDSMLRKDGAALNALTELQQIGNKLLQMK
ncbi:uncharacterized protein LOC131065483 isoform X2 [Cryptomeria japonica]|nr:uncharacterized protein LOC131065483 isoform X2 [Cryptomeria japonica]XP_057855979.2 uncharacterized protein LOC131065483 isoform X2 [Cryptomeria japonica]XP_057855984.2 uncharacterized protein LOC131065483 isoform X2 [Cryptomeria japonica]